MSGCCNFGREDELFPFEEEALKYIEGINPNWRIGREFSIPSWKEEIGKRLKSFENVLCGSEEEEKVKYIREKLFHLNPSKEEFIHIMYLIDRFLFPLLERLVFFKANAPEGEEELRLIVEEIEALSPGRRVSDPTDALEVLISYLP